MIGAGFTGAALAYHWSKKAPPERTLVVAKHGPPQSMKEADYRLEEAEKRRRETRKARRWMTALTLGFLLFGVAAGLYGNLLKLLPLGVMLGLLMLTGFFGKRMIEA